MNYKFQEKFKIDAETLHLTSAAGATSQPYDMAGTQDALFLVNVRGTYSTARVDLMASTAANAAMSSGAAGTTGREVGGAATAITAAGGVKAIILTMASATGTTDAVQFNMGLGTVIKKFVYTTSTALFTKSSAQTSTKIYFGSTIGSTVNAGLTACIDNLTTWLNNTTFGFGNQILKNSTPTTDSAGFIVADTENGSLVFNTTNAFFTAVVSQAVCAYNIKGDNLSTTEYTHAGVKISTIATGVGAAGITVIRNRRYAPGVFVGKQSS